MKRTVGFLQFAPRMGDPGWNMARIEQLAAGTRFDLLVLPELCTTGYQFRDRAHLAGLAEPADGPFGALLGELTRRHGGTIVGGFAEQSVAGTFNSALTVTPDGRRYVYRKAHLFDREKTLFLTGDTPFEPVDIGWDCPIGIMICFDWIFPEAMRSLALQGAGVIAHAANLVMPFCQQAMFCRAIENRVFVITANRHGSESLPGEEPLTFTGRSQVMGPDGTVRLSASRAETGIRLVEIDTGETGFQLNSRNNLVADRRPELYNLN